MVKRGEKKEKTNIDNVCAVTQLPVRSLTHYLYNYTSLIKSLIFAERFRAVAAAGTVQYTPLSTRVVAHVVTRRVKSGRMGNIARAGSRNALQSLPA